MTRSLCGVVNGNSGWPEDYESQMRAGLMVASFCHARAGSSCARARRLIAWSRFELTGWSMLARSYESESIAHATRSCDSRRARFVVVTIGAFGRARDSQRGAACDWWKAGRERVCEKKKSSRDRFAGPSDSFPCLCVRSSYTFLSSRP